MTKPFVFEKFRGVNNVLPEDALHTGEGVYLRTAVNVDIDNAFKVRRRKGYRRIAAGQVHSLWSDGRICLFREGKALKRLFENYSIATLRDDLGGDLPMSFLSVDGTVYYSDTLISGIVQDGRSRSWGIVPPPTPDVAPTLGIARPGRYLVAATYVRKGDQESGTDSPAAITLVSTGGIAITLRPSADPDVVATRLYISAPNGDVLYSAGDHPNDSRTVIYSGTALGLELKTFLLQQPPPGQLLEYFMGKVYIAAGQFVFPTKAYGYELVDFDDYLPFAGIVGLLGAVDDGLYISDGKMTAFLEGGKKLHDPLPHAAIPGTMVKVDLETIGEGGMSGQGLVWASDRGIILGMKGGATKNLTEGRYVYPVASWGAGLFRQQNGINQYVALLREGEGQTDRVYKWQKITSGDLELSLEVTGSA